MDLWVEKYRPKTFEDIIGLTQDTVQLIKRDVPNILLTGIVGTGKTSLAKVIIKQGGHEALYLNASDDRGIDIIRNVVKKFAQSKSVNGKIKIVLLDEGDQIVSVGQNALRNMIETYSKNCRFIITGNYDNKIIPAIKSRCLKINMEKPSKTLLLRRLKHIVLKENITVQDEILIAIVTTHYPDIRSMINTLQRLSMKKTITIDDVKKEAIISSNAIWSYLLKGDFINARKEYLSSNCDEETIINDLHDLLMESNLLPKKKANVILSLSECLKWLPNVAIKQILFEETMINIIRGVQ